MKNSKFIPLFETIYNRFKDGSGFLAGDVVKFKTEYKNLDCYKNLGENVKQRIDDIIKSGNNIRVGRLHNKDASFGALGGTSCPACHADLYEEVAPSFWRNLVTVPVECLETNNPAIDLPPVPANQKDKPRAYQKPLEATKDKPNKGAEIDEQTKVGKKQTHAQKGDYELATNNTKLDNSNNYDDSKPSKVKGLEKAKELKETYEGLYERMLTEDVGAIGQSAPGMSDEGDQLAGNPPIQSEEEQAPSSTILPPPAEMETMTDDQVLQAFHNLGRALGNDTAKFSQAVHDYASQVSPELLQRIKDLSHRNKANKAGLAQ